MRIFLDPHREGCTVWFSDGNIQTLRGSIDSVCRRIENYVTDYIREGNGEPKKIQTVEVFLDRMGVVGNMYYSNLIDLKVSFKTCTFNKIIE